MIGFCGKGELVVPEGLSGDSAYSPLLAKNAFRYR